MSTSYLGEPLLSLQPLPATRFVNHTQDTKNIPCPQSLVLFADEATYESAFTAVKFGYGVLKTRMRQVNTILIVQR
jgi:hypothetical protein